MNLLIVDDEKMTRDTLTGYLPWSELGVDRIETAANGMEAVQLLATFHPDIVLTDIRMPRMNGIQLAEYIRRLLPACPIVFMSGYSDQQYLKSAIRLSVSSYIEKPIKLDEVESEMRKAIAVRKGNLYSSLSLLKTELVAELLRPEAERNHDRVALLMDHFRLQPSQPCIAIAASIHWPANMSSGERLTASAAMLDLLAQTEDLFAAALEPELIACAVFRTGLSEESNHTARDEFLRQVAVRMTAASPCLVTFCIGGYGAHAASFPDSFRLARETIRLQFVCGYGHVVDGNSIRNGTFTPETALYKQFKEHVQSNRLEAATALIRELTAAICKYPRTERNEIKNIYFHLLLILYQDAPPSEAASVQDSVSEGTYFWQDINEFITLHELADYVIDAANTRLAEQTQPETRHASIAAILQYIDEHYDEERLSVGVLAKHVFLRHTYLCFLFKKQIGKTVNEYITEFRLKKAIELMKHGPLKLIDIAGAVGFADANHFGKLFKKYTGVTPSEYRKR